MTRKPHELPDHQHNPTLSTVGLLVPGPRTDTTKLLGLAPPVVGHQQCPVVLYEGLLELVLSVLVDVFLVVSDLVNGLDLICSTEMWLGVSYNGLGDGLSDGVDLGCVTTAGDADADVDVGCSGRIRQFTWPRGTGLR